MSNNSKLRNVGIITLGCARNIVDSQKIIGELKRDGYEFVSDIKDADMAIVNTCAFVEDAKLESIETILDLIELKKKGRLKRIVVAGCLSQRYRDELVSEFSEVDEFIGVQPLYRDEAPQDISLTPPHFAYLKICESCYHKCSFCVIPQIKGKFSSRSIDSILKEVQKLNRRGIKELNIIGQDITAYGIDIYGDRLLPQLLKSIISVAEDIEWIRLLYLHPVNITDELIDLIAAEDKICKYVDIPLQHINDDILFKMNRNTEKKYILDLIRKIRDRISDVCIRTTFIVGFPSETDEQFSELMEFVDEIRFNRLGAFMFSREEGTPAYSMSDQIPDEIKAMRYDALMRLQQEISFSLMQDFIGKTIRVLVDKQIETASDVPDYIIRDLPKGINYIARSEYDAPEVDGTVIINTADKQLRSGDLVTVKITKAFEYDLLGELV